MSIVIPKLDKVHTTIESILSTYSGDGPIRCFWPHQIQKNVNEFRRLLRVRLFMRSNATRLPVCWRR